MQIDRAYMLLNDLIKYHCPSGTKGELVPVFDSKHTLGVTKGYKNCTVKISKVFIIKNSEYSVLTLIIHEIAHVLSPDDRGHGSKWCQRASELGIEPRQKLSNVIT